MAVIIDANVFFAFRNDNDIHHSKAKRIMKEILSDKKERAITSDYIFDEVLGVTMRKTSRKDAIELGAYIKESQINLVYIDPLTFDLAWELFKHTSKLSFTDCTTLVYMKLLGIKKVATFDKAFNEIKKIEIMNN